MGRYWKSWDFPWSRAGEVSGLILGICPQKSYSGSGHRITEWFGLEGTLKVIQFEPAAMGRELLYKAGSCYIGQGAAM